MTVADLKQLIANLPDTTIVNLRYQRQDFELTPAVGTSPQECTLAILVEQQQGR